MVEQDKHHLLPVLQYFVAAAEEVAPVLEQLLALVVQVAVVAVVLPIMALQMVHPTLAAVVAG